MGREGKNPAKWQRGGFAPADVTIVTVVNIPHLSGYWSEALDILKVCITSMRYDGCVAADVMVYDNASCAEVHEYLHACMASGQIQYLYRSHANIGKTAAENQAFAAAPGSIVSYMDCDVLCLPGWLDESLAVLNAFPRAGMVTAQCLRLFPEEWHASIASEASADPEIAVDTAPSLIDDMYLRAYSIGLGEPEDQYVARVSSANDIVLRSGNIAAYVNALHFQFTARKALLMSLLPLPTTMLLGDDDYALDNGVIRAGYWKLCTEAYLVHHMGNRMPDWTKELPWLAPPDLGASRVCRAPGGVVRNHHLRRALRAVNVATYKLLYR